MVFSFKIKQHFIIHLIRPGVKNDAFFRKNGQIALKQHPHKEMGYIFWLFTDFYFYSDGTTNRPSNAIDYHSTTH